MPDRTERDFLDISINSIYIMNNHQRCTHFLENKSKKQIFIPKEKDITNQSRILEPNE